VASQSLCLKARSIAFQFGTVQPDTEIGQVQTELCQDVLRVRPITYNID